MEFVIRGAIGVALYFLIRPQPGSKSSATNTGRLWLAWSILLPAFAYYPHQMGLANEIAARLVGMVVIGAIAFTIGAVVGWNKSRRSQTPSSEPVEYPQTTTTGLTRKIPNTEIPFTPTASQQLDVDGDRIYALIATELETGAQEKGLWTRLFAQCGGDEKQTKVLYIKERANRLIFSERSRLEQAEQAASEESAHYKEAPGEEQPAVIPIDPTKIQCGSCKRMSSRKEKYCSYCGYNLDAEPVYSGG